jgi:hypothetical protein
MQQYLHTGKQDLEKRTQWKVINMKQFMDRGKMQEHQ